MAIGNLDTTQPTTGQPASGGAAAIVDIKTQLKASFPAFTIGNDICTLTGAQIDDAARKAVANTFSAQNTFSQKVLITKEADGLHVAPVTGSAVVRVDAVSPASAYLDIRNTANRRWVIHSNGVDNWLRAQIYTGSGDGTLAFTPMQIRYTDGQAFFLVRPQLSATGYALLDARSVMLLRASMGVLAGASGMVLSMSAFSQVGAQGYEAAAGKITFDEAGLYRFDYGGTALLSSTSANTTSSYLRLALNGSGITSSETHFNVYPSLPTEAIGFKLTPWRSYTQNVTAGQYMQLQYGANHDISFTDLMLIATKIG